MPGIANPPDIGEQIIMSTHRTEERRAALQEARVLVKRIMEDASACGTRLMQLSPDVWGNPEATDFGGTDAEQSARLYETTVGIAAGTMLFSVLDQPVGEYGVTVRQALLRIAAP